MNFLDNLFNSDVQESSDHEIFMQNFMGLNQVTTTQ